MPGAHSDPTSCPRANVNPRHRKRTKPRVHEPKSATTPGNAEPQSRCDELAKVPLKGQPGRYWVRLARLYLSAYAASSRVLGPAVLGREPSEQVLIVLIVSSSLAASPN